MTVKRKIVILQEIGHFRLQTAHFPMNMVFLTFLKEIGILHRAQNKLWQV